MVERCRQRYEGRLEVRLGMETDYFPGLREMGESLHQRAAFHYCLGSVHWQGPEYHDRFETWNPADFRRSYWQNLAASAETGLFDCLAHPDLIKNYRIDHMEVFRVGGGHCRRAGSHREDRRLHGAEHLGHEQELSRDESRPRHAAHDARARHPCRHRFGLPSPGPRGRQFRRCLQTLQKAGYTEVSVFQNRKRSALPIADSAAAVDRRGTAA